MKNSYFVTFGSKIENVDALTEKLQNKLLMKFEKRSSDYLGDYTLYKGHIETLYVEKNYKAFLEEYIEDNRYTTIIQLSVINGKEKDKKERYIYLKELLSEIAEIEMISEKIMQK